MTSENLRLFTWQKVGQVWKTLVSVFKGKRQWRMTDINRIRTLGWHRIISEAVLWTCCRHLGQFSSMRAYCEEISRKHTDCWHTASVLIRLGHYICSWLSKFSWWAMAGVAPWAAADLEYSTHTHRIHNIDWHTLVYTKPFQDSGAHNS